jgi:hypothetical protein
MTQPTIAQSIFPDYPRESPAIDKKGNFTTTWSLQLNALFQALQKNYKNEGIVFPPLTQDQQNTIQGIYTAYIGSPLPGNVPDISGQTIFDSTNRLPKQFIITYDNSAPPNVLSAQWLIMNVMLLNAGDPNGSVAGVLYWFCYDITNKVLYICTTSGSTGTSVWTVV